MVSPLARTKSIWRGMKNRCLNRKDPRWKDYGGRGIVIAPSWMVFEAFYSDMGLAPEGRQLDRIDNDKGYSRENCRWATRGEQQSNMRTNRWIEFNGKRQTLSQWARELGIHNSSLYRRLEIMPLNEAMQAGRSSIQKRRVSNVVRCSHCGYERAVTRAGKFCYKCHYNEAGECYTRIWEKAKQNAKTVRRSKSRGDNPKMQKGKVSRI